jgi:hypothetical protein
VLNNQITILINKTKIMENQDQNSNKPWSNFGSGIFIGCMFVGMGIGMYIGQLAVGTLVGMGVGFIASALVKAKR